MKLPPNPMKPQETQYRKLLHAVCAEASEIELGEHAVVFDRVAAYIKDF